VAHVRGMMGKKVERREGKGVDQGHARGRKLNTLFVWGLPLSPLALWVLSPRRTLLETSRRPGGSTSPILNPLNGPANAWEKLLRFATRKIMGGSP